MSEQPETPKPGRSADEVAHDIETDIRRTIGGWVGAQPDDDWDTIGRMMEANFRGRIAEFFGVEPGEAKGEVTWDDIGHKVDRDLRKSIGGWAGAQPDDDWDTVGEKVDEKIRASASEAAGAKPAGEAPASWDEIGAKIEANTRKGIGSWVGADPDATWDEIGDRYAERIRGAFSGKGESDKPASASKTQVPISGEESQGEDKPQA